MTTATARYIDTKPAAAMLRAALAKRFPRTRFSVRISRYSMGSSISVHWTDGPSLKAVQEIVAPFETKGFDSSDDSTTFGTSWLDKDGDLTTERPATYSAEEVYFGAWIHPRRNLSPAFAQRLADQVTAFRGWEPVTLQTHGPLGGWSLPVTAPEQLNRLIHEAAEDRTRFQLKVAPTELEAAEALGLGELVKPATLELVR